MAACLLSPQPTPGVQLVNLPYDILVLLADFLQTNVLSYVCSRLWALLQHRHMRIMQEDDAVLKALKGSRHVHTMHIHGAPTDAEILQHFPMLHSITMEFSSTVCTGVPNLEAICLALKAAPAVRYISLGLRSCRLRVGCATPLLHLAQCRSLEDLHLNLASNGLGYSDLEALVLAFKDVSTLTALSLDLSNNRLGAGGAEPLGLLAGATQLRCLALHLESNGLATIDVEALAQLAVLPSLEQLTLDLSTNRLREGDTAPLTAFSQNNTLKKLTVKLRDNGLAAGDAEAFGALRDAGALQALTLDLGRNRLGPGDATPLGNLSDAPQLQELAINLEVNGVSEDDVRALAQLHKAPKLVTLQLNLSLNGLGDDDVAPLASLSLAPMLRSLALDLSCNGIRHVQHLGALKDSPGLQCLQLILGSNLLEGTLPCPAGRDPASLAGSPVDCMGPTCGNLEALAALKDACALENLLLDLSYNELSACDVEGLRLLRQAPALRKLTLNLSHVGRHWASLWKLRQELADPQLALHVIV